MRSFIVLLVAVLAFLPFAPRGDAQAQNNFQTHHDTIPNFAQNPTIRSVRSGSWSTPTTWNPARVPTTSDIVLITHVVVYDSTTGNPDTIGIGIGGILRFSTTQSTMLRVANLLVQPNGALEVGTASTPIPEHLTAEIIIKNKALNTTIDPDQYGTSLLSIDGNVTMHGAVKTPTFARVSVEPRVGHATLTLDQPVSGWRVGDRLFVPDSRQVDENNKFNANYALQMEEVSVQSISADGRTITISPSLRYDHRGARDADGTPTVLSDGTRLLPHVGNLSRNVVIRSENPSGTRGHTLFTHRSEIDIRYVQFQDLGRTRATGLDPVTNHIGRYPLHIHHLWGPVNPTNTGYQFELVGNAVNDSLKWPIAIHGSHYGHIRQNVVYGGSQLTGAGIAIEDGTETDNLLEENFVVNIRGDINPRNSGPSTAAGSTPGAAAECFWTAGFNNRFVGNVASGCRNPFQQIVSGPCWKMIVPPAPYTARNPRFRGADMTDATQTISVTPQRQPILEFRDNECYGLAADGFTAWNLGTDGYDMPTVPESVLKNFRVWHTYEAAVWNYPVNHLTIDGLVYRIDPAGVLYWPPAVSSGDYRDIDLTIRGGSIHAGSVFGGVVAPLRTIRIENIDAITREYAFNFDTPYTPGTGAGQPDPPGVTVTLLNNLVRPWPGQPLRTIDMSFRTGANTYPNTKYEIFVYNYQGQSGNNFRVYYTEQATQNVAGGRAPCTDTQPEIDGLICPIDEAPGSPPLAAPTDLKVSN
jgi:hypothetical protein